MKAAIDYSQKSVAEKEFISFINEGLKDAYNNSLLDFDTVFDELEERYKVTNG